MNRHIGELPDKVERTGFASAEGLTVFDGVHFDRRSQAALGARYAEAMLRVLEGNPR